MEKRQEGGVGGGTVVMQPLSGQVGMGRAIGQCQGCSGRVESVGEAVRKADARGANILGDISNVSLAYMGGLRLVGPFAPNYCKVHLVTHVPALARAFPFVSRFLTSSLSPSLPRSLSPSLPLSLSPSLSSLPLSLSPCLPPSLPPSYMRALPLSLPLSLPPCVE